VGGRIAKGRRDQKVNSRCRRIARLKDLFEVTASRSTASPELCLEVGTDQELEKRLLGHEIAYGGNPVFGQVPTAH